MANKRKIRQNNESEVARSELGVRKDSEAGGKVYAGAVQCVSEASVTVEGRAVGAIGKGYAILLGVGHGDTEAEAERLWRKIAKMRVFSKTPRARRT